MHSPGVTDLYFPVHTQVVHRVASSHDFILSLAIFGVLLQAPVLESCGDLRDSFGVDSTAVARDSSQEASAHHFERGRN